MKLKIASVESGDYAMVPMAEALAKGGVKLMPDVVAGGGAGAGTLVDVPLANLIREVVAGPPRAEPRRRARSGRRSVRP